jgi:hypothetical protein
MLRLQNIKTYFICPDHNEKYQKRRQHMEALLTRLGFTNWHHYKSGTDRYPKCLSDAICDILSQNLDEPVLILEDDVECSGRLEFDMPDGCDAIFFGLSRSAGSATCNIHKGDSRFATFSDKQVRVLNMLSMHALLFVSRRIKEEYLDILRKNTVPEYNTDILFSRIQSNFLVLANKFPAFWQANQFNPHNDLERVTKVCIPGISYTNVAPFYDQPV